MFTRSRNLVILAALVVVLAGAVAARAEVSAVLDSQGRYVRTVVLSAASIQGIEIWSVRVPRTGYVPLNPDGDLNGDLWPLIAEDPLDSNHPWVVWSRFNGIDYDLAWSHWSNGSWKEVRWLERLPRAGDDLDPSLELGGSGRPYVAWWGEDGGLGGKVYFSMFLDTRWMTAYLVSDADVDSRYPTVHPNEDGSITIDYLTPAGPQSRTILVKKGVSINDDLDPVGNLSSSVGQ